MRLLITAIFCVLMLACLVLGALCGDMDVKPQDYWMEVYYEQPKAEENKPLLRSHFGGPGNYERVKIGYMHVTVGKKTVDGKECICREENITLRFRLDGRNEKFDATHTTCTDHALQLMSDTLKCQYTHHTTTGSGDIAITFASDGGKMRVVDNGQTNEQAFPVEPKDRVSILWAAFMIWVQKSSLWVIVSILVI